ncbi:hypothetical protein G6N74_13205 [Mesorhizobium sp. CGMCC 1.15528]|uniref:Uncharacterized protein n=1 Tax=Mesorhizobium zhangyense TaxID=1776730 RepID=A0A7C9V7W3_9HYPH|nr:hypothetical protein [Mesorhizobium zhangyense]NGN42023.1 hypothetical protein [Mesorhizobium zhangyense]
MYSLLHSNIGKIVPKPGAVTANSFCIPPSGVARLLVMLTVIVSAVHVLDVASSYAPDRQPGLLAQADVTYERR